MTTQHPKVVAFGGGHGLHASLSALRLLEEEGLPNVYAPDVPLSADVSGMLATAGHVAVASLVPLPGFDVYVQV